MIKGIIFDYDGVLEDTFHRTFQASINIAKKLGKKPLTEEEYRKHHVAWRDFYQQQGYTEQEIENMPSLFDAEMKKMGNQAEFFDGIENMIAKTAKKFRLAIVSGGHEHRIKETLEKRDLLRFFDIIIGIETSGKLSKPNAYPVVLCAQKMSLMPSEICFVGDTNEDILSGRNANVGKIVAVTYGYQSRERLLAADIIVDSPQELHEVLEGLA